MNVIIGIAALIVIVIIYFIVHTIYMKLSTENILFNPKNIEESHFGTLIVQDIFNSEFEGYIWDFSKYDENEIIGMQLHSKRKPPKSLEKNYTEPVIIHNATVYKIKNEGYIWDYRPFQ